MSFLQRAERKRLEQERAEKELRSVIPLNPDYEQHIFARRYIDWDLEKIYSRMMAEHKTISRLLKEVHAAEEGRLAAARRADHHHDLALADLGRNALQHLEIPEALLEVLYLEQCLCHLCLLTLPVSLRYGLSPDTPRKLNVL